MKFKLLTIIVGFLFFALNIHCQTKNEKEERVKSSAFPKKALQIIEVLPKKTKRLKLYRETDGDKTSYEAKFKYKKRRYSLEFSKDGIMEDIEVVTKYKHIKDSIKKQISTYLKETYTKHKFIKIQESFIYDSSVDTSQFITDVLNENSKAKMNFEIIAEVKSEKHRDIREFTFDQKGQFIDFRILEPTSYEHVLY